MAVVRTKKATYKEAIILCHVATKNGDVAIVVSAWDIQAKVVPVGDIIYVDIPKAERERKEILLTFARAQSASEENGDVILFPATRWTARQGPIVVTRETAQKLIASGAWAEKPVLRIK
jgi:hypothetical protein